MDEVACMFVGLILLRMTVVEIPMTKKNIWMMNTTPTAAAASPAPRERVGGRGSGGRTMVTTLLPGLAWPDEDAHLVQCFLHICTCRRC